MTGSEAVVIGGGAAGIAATRALVAAGRDVILIEARDRLGGRAHTVTVEGHALDLGCGWLHSADRNPLVALAEAEGFRIDRTGARWGSQWRDLGFPPDEHAAFGDAMEGWHKAALAGAGDAIDRPLSAFATDPTWRPLLDAISGFANGAPMDRISTQDWAAYETAATDCNWRLPQGYGALITRLGDGLPARLGVVVRGIDQLGARLRIETGAGAIETRTAIVCLPSAVLARSDLVPTKSEAAAALPLGLADKLFLRVEGRRFPDDTHLTGNPHSDRTMGYQLAPMGMPIVECFIGGDLAEALVRESDAAAVDFAVGELANLLGSDWRTAFRPLARTRWRADAYALGSYSHAAIGQQSARAALAEPIDDRLFFAGEACSPADFSTCHGAWATGLAAAEAALTGLSRSP